MVSCGTTWPSPSAAGALAADCLLPTAAPGALATTSTSRELGDRFGIRIRSMFGESPPTGSPSSAGTSTGDETVGARS